MSGPVRHLSAPHEAVTLAVAADEFDVPLDRLQRAGRNRHLFVFTRDTDGETVVLVQEVSDWITRGSLVEAGETI
jgi:hypothetical protein